MGPADDDADSGPLDAAYAVPVEDSSTHPISATATARLREVLRAAFDAAALTLGVGDAPAVEVRAGRVETDPGSVETSTTRTAATGDGQIVLHETTTRDSDDAEVRMTIALTGSSVEGERFWLGATSYGAARVERVELVGELPAFVAPVLGQVLIALRQGPPG